MIGFHHLIKITIFYTLRLMFNLGMYETLYYYYPICLCGFYCRFVFGLNVVTKGLLYPISIGASEVISYVIYFSLHGDF